MMRSFQTSRSNLIIPSAVLAIVCPFETRLGPANGARMSSMQFIRSRDFGMYDETLCFWDNLT